MYVTGTKEGWTVVSAENKDGKYIVYPRKIHPFEDLLATALPFKKTV